MEEKESAKRKREVAEMTKKNILNKDDNMKEEEESKGRIGEKKWYSLKGINKKNKDINKERM